MEDLNRRKGRTLMTTVTALMESVRLRIAIDNFKNDPMLLKAILIELGMESQQVAKNSIIKQVNTWRGLDKYELVPYLKQYNDFNTYNLWWGLSSVEQKLYSLDPKGVMSEKERRDAFEKVKAMFLNESGQEFTEDDDS